MSGKRLTRREFLKGIATTGVGLGLAACGPKPAAPAEGATPVEQATVPAEELPAVSLRYQSFQSGDVVAKWDEQFAEFEKETGIKVTNEYVPWGETIEKTLTMAAGGELPDIAMVSGNWHRALVVRGVFADLTDAKWETMDVDDFWPKLLGGYKHENRIYGFPTDLDLQLVFYNKDLFDQAGVSYPEEGWTWDDYRDMAAELTQGEGVGKIYGSTTPDKAMALMIAWCYGGDLVDPDTLEVVIDEPAGVRAMNLINDLLVVDKSAPLPGTEGVGMDTGQIAMGMYGPWAGWYIFKDIEFSWDVSPVPQGSQRAVLSGLP